MRFFIFIFLPLSISLGKSYGQHSHADSLKEELSEHPQEDTIRVALLIQLATDETYDHPLLAGNYAFEASTISEKINFPKGVALAYRLLGNSFWSQANQSAALDHFLRALKIADSIHNPQIQADLMGNLGMVYNDMGDYEKALSYYRASLAKQIELKN